MSNPSRPLSTSESTDDQATPAEREEQARQLCLRLLTARARTRAELAERMAKKGYPADVGERVLDRLADVGLIDDRDFAEQWVRSRTTHAGKGKRALVSELRTKGVDDEVIDAALADVDPESERVRAEQLVADRLRREKFADDPGEDVKLTRRLVGMLARRGYGQSLAFDVVKVALASERERRRV